MSKASIPSIESIQALLAAQRHVEAAEAARRWIARSPRGVEAHLLLVRSLLPPGRIAEAHEAALHGLRMVPKDPRLELLAGVIEHRLGRSDEAIARLERLVDASPPNRIEASIALAEALHRAGRSEAFAAFAAKGGRWTEDPRAAVFLARVVAKGDREAAIAMLESSFEASSDPLLRRVAGFEAAKHLDAAGRYREAYDLAARVHEATTPRFDLGEIEREIAEQRRRLAAGRGSYPRGPRSRTERRSSSPCRGAAPRCSNRCSIAIRTSRGSASSRASSISASPCRRRGIGRAACSDWARSRQRELAARYRQGARARCRTRPAWTFDKTLLAWRWLPAIAAVLPGARLLRIERDPRDAAISMFLSNFHPRTWGATASLDSIRRLVELERTIVPEALDALGLAHVSLAYETLVAEPRREIARCLDLLGLPFDESVLAPERNDRTVLTLSHEQVRRPINASSIGRWRNYAFAFDERWEALAGANRVDG